MALLIAALALLTALIVFHIINRRVEAARVEAIGRLVRLADKDGRVAGKFWDQSLRGFFARGGRHFVLRYVWRSGLRGGRAVEALALSVPLQVPREFRAWPKRDVYDFIEKSFSRNMLSGDPRFDADYDIESEDPDSVAAVFADAGVRESIGRLLSLGARHVALDAGQLEAAWPQRRFSKPGEAKNSFIEAAGCLGELAERLRALARPEASAGARDAAVAAPQAQPHQAIRAEGQKGWELTVLLAVLSLIAAAVGAANAFGFWVAPGALDRGALVLQSLRLSLPSLAVFLYLFERFSGGNPRRGGLHALVWLAAAYGFAAIGAVATASLNARLDRAPATAHAAAVLQKNGVCPGDGAARSVTVKSWRARRGSEELCIAASDDDRLAAGRSVLTVFTRPGRFGFEWAASYDIAPAREIPARHSH